MRAGLLLAAFVLVAPLASVSAAAVPPLVAAGSGCDPVNGGDPMLPRLTDRIVAAMKAFRAGRRPATVMDRITKGFTDDEIAAIAASYAEQQ